ncbi:MAG: division/cell wall cluster transcriptional repressor MraZ [Candidatus Omnitrophica bacterium]|nr:division/cell wall cluster transcriptional repressor MraZ [Candidatus Omnitrophota bacterium]
MFYGEFSHSLDDKGRIVLPARLREVCVTNGIEQFFLTRGLDQCIFMFTAEEWGKQEQKFRALSFTKQQARTFNRLFFSGAVDIVPDKQGRFVVPQYLKDYASISKETVIIGVSNRIEIWDQNIWNAFYQNSNASYEQIAEQMIDL